MRASFGRKSRGNSIGKKQSGFKKGVKTLGLALVAGAGIYAATHSTDKEHQNHDAEQSRTQVLDEQREKLASEGAKPAPAPALEFGKSGKGGKLDKAEDILAVAGAGIDAARDVDESTGKFGKVKAVAKGAKSVKDKAKEVGAKDKQAKFEEGLLTDEQAKKFAKKQMKVAEEGARTRLCDSKYPPGSGLKVAAKRNLCYKTGQ